MSQATLQPPAPQISRQAAGAPAVALPFAAIVLAMLPGGPRPDDPGHRAARRRRPTSVGSPTSHGSSPRTSSPRRRRRPVGQARRPLRSQAAARGIALRLRRQLGAVRRGAGRHAAHRPARRPGRGRRRPDDAWRWPPSATSSPRASAVATRATSRRPSPWRPSSARSSAASSSTTRAGAGSSFVNLPIGARRARRPAPAPAGARGRGRRTAARRVGRRAAGRRDDRPDADLHLGRGTLRMGLEPHRRSHRHDRRPVGRPGRARAPRRRPDRPLPPAAHRAGGDRQRRAVPGRPRRCSRSPSSCRCSWRRRQARVRPTPACCWSPAMLGIAVSTTLSGRAIVRTGRYKRFPIAGLALMTVALVLLAAFAAIPRRSPPAIALGVFGLGFGMVTQVLVVGRPEQRRSARARRRDRHDRLLPRSRRRRRRRRPRRRVRGAGRRHGTVQVSRADVIGAVQAVFVVAAPLAALALLVVLRLPEVPLQTADRKS